MSEELKLTDQMTLAEAIAKATVHYADQEALVFEDQHVTYGELGEKINAVAAGLHEMGLQRGEKVAIITSNCLEYIYVFFGASHAGGVVVPVNPTYRQREVKHIVEDSEASMIVFQPKVQGNDLMATVQGIRGDLPLVRDLIVVADSAPEGMVTLDSLLDAGYEPIPPQAELDDLFGLIYTSGTTGVPKGAMHTHRTMMAPVVAGGKLREALFAKPSLKSAVGMARTMVKFGGRFRKWAGKQMTMLNPSPFHAMAGYATIVNGLPTGMRLVIMERFHPVRILELTEKEHVNILSCTPTHYALMLDVREFDDYDKSSVLYCSMGAAPCPPDLVRQVRTRWGCPVLIGFGATETSGAATITSITDNEKMQSETVGQAYPGVELKIVDDERREVPHGTVGEVATKMPGVMKGYYKAPEATAAALDDEGWYYTGDLGTMDKKGFVKIVGRKKDMIIRGGANVYPAEVEAVLIAHPKVREAAVIGVPSELEGETVWAYVVPKAGETLTVHELLTYSRREMAAYKVPQEIRIVEDLPRTPTQKVRKFQLREQATEELAERLSAVPV